MGQSALASSQVGFHEGRCLMGVTWTTENPYRDNQNMVGPLDRGGRLIGGLFTVIF